MKKRLDLPSLLNKWNDVVIIHQSFINFENSVFEFFIYGWRDGINPNSWHFSWKKFLCSIKFKSSDLSISIWSWWWRSGRFQRGLISLFILKPSDRSFINSIYFFQILEFLTRNSWQPLLVDDILMFWNYSGILIFNFLILDFLILGSLDAL